MCVCVRIDPHFVIYIAHTFPGFCLLITWGFSDVHIILFLSNLIYIHKAQTREQTHETKGNSLADQYAKQFAFIQVSFIKDESPVVAQQVKNPTSIHEDVGLIPGLTQWVKDLALLQAAA